MNLDTLYKIANGLIVEQTQSGDPEGKLRAEGIAYLYNFIVRELKYQQEVLNETGNMSHLATPERSST